MGFDMLSLGSCFTTTLQHPPRHHTYNGNLFSACPDLIGPAYRRQCVDKKYRHLVREEPARHPEHHRPELPWLQLSNRAMMSIVFVQHVTATSFVDHSSGIEILTRAMLLRLTPVSTKGILAHPAVLVGVRYQHAQNR